MPELPEVETMCRGISPVINGRVTATLVPKCKYRPIQITPQRRQITRRIKGQKIVGVDRLGKRPILRFDNDERLVFEPRMTGLLLIADPPDASHLRFGLALDGVRIPELWFWDRRGLGTVRLYDPSEFETHLGPGRVGPDAIQVTADQMKEQLGTSRRDIKVALLDQRAVAGVGNLYASELLHVAGIDPRKKCHRISDARWSRLHSAMREVLFEAIKYEGSTLNDGTFRNALNQDGRYQNHHRVYMRDGEACPTCDAGVIRRIVQAQRSTFFCPKCQRR